jgi:hypothetical protein
MCALEDSAMSRERRNKHREELRGPGSRQVLEALRQISEEMSDFEDHTLPEVPAGVLMKRRSDGGGVQMR